MNQTVVISCLFVKCRASMAGLCAAGYPQTLGSDQLFHNRMERHCPMNDGNETNENLAYPGFFIGRIPPFLFFEMEYHSLCALVESHKNEKPEARVDQKSEELMREFQSHYEEFVQAHPEHADQRSEIFPSGVCSRT